jgi:hypothetical protein
MENVGTLARSSSGLRSCRAVVSGTGCVGAIVLFILCTKHWSLLGMLIAERTIYVTSGAFETTLAGVFSDRLVALAQASYALSVATNGIATALIAYKAWSVLRRLERHLMLML